MQPNRSLLDLLLETQSLDRVPRIGFALRGVARPESVSEHGWHVALLVWALAPEPAGLDLGKALAMALIHDLAEVRLGDLPMTAGRYFAGGAKAEAERAALSELTAPLGDRASRLFVELEKGTSPEARLVKACDKLQLMLKVAAYERAGAAGLAEFWANSENFPAAGIEAIDRLLAELRRRFDPLRA